ncbi:hypothetical protein ACWFRB_12560 [Rhodococcus sp. NPDC055112]
MPHSTGRRTVARLAAATAAAALLAAGVTGPATAQSADAFGSHDASATRATKTHDNLTITHEIVGSNVGYLGDEVHYRTTVSATDGPARTITGIEEGISDLVGCSNSWTLAKSGTVTYTNTSGAQVSESMPKVLANVMTRTYEYPAVGSWTVDPAAGTTVVYDSVRVLRNARGGFSMGCDWEGNASPSNMNAYLTVRADGLALLDWRPTGVTASCALACSLPRPTDSGGSAFGS